MSITKESLEARFQAKREEIEQIEQQLQGLEQQVGQARLQHQKALGQIQTLQELYSELEESENQPTEVLELDNSQQPNTDT